MRAAVAVVTAFFGALPSFCERNPWLHPGPVGDRGPAPPAAQATARAPAVASNYVRMEVLDAAASPPTFVMRGEPHGSGRLVFIHGMCGHGLGYAQSFQRSAANFGVLIAPQGDVPCAPGSPWAKWSYDTVALDARITSAFRALGATEPIEDITVIGYSQGAWRAEVLARRWPKRYTRLVFIAGPQKISPYGLSAQVALMMAGTLDRQDLMQSSARAFAAAGKRARYMQLPNARHGEMGSTPEKTMGDALTWLYGETETDAGRR